MRFWLPAAPSPHVLSLLQLACQEMRRLAAMRPPADALALLQWHVAGGVAGAYAALLLPPDSALRKRVTEKGALQVRRRKHLQLLYMVLALLVSVTQLFGPPHRRKRRHKRRRKRLELPGVAFETLCPGYESAVVL